MEKFVKLYKKLLSENTDESKLFAHLLKHLVDVVDFNGAQILYSTENKPKAQCGKCSGSFENFDLAISDTVFGSLRIYGNLSQTDIICLQTYASLISYLIKDRELSLVFKTQTKMLQKAIKEKNEAIKATEKQNKKLLQEQKIKNEIFTNVSHELRTPLNAIIGFAQLLENEKTGSLNQKQLAYVKDINTSSIKLLGMVNEILDISKIQAKAMKLNLCSFDISVAITEVINILKPLSEKRGITIEYNEFQRTVKADFQKFQQILFNLLSNAIKFTSQNGAIEITTDFSSDKFKLSVKDNGIGIEKKYHNKIFAKFVQLHNLSADNKSSTGLGLPITKELVKLHKGKIYLESVVNKGTKFIVEFPQ